MNEEDFKIKFIQSLNLDNFLFHLLHMYTGTSY